MHYLRPPSQNHFVCDEEEIFYACRICHLHVDGVEQEEHPYVCPIHHLHPHLNHADDDDRPRYSWIYPFRLPNLNHASFFFFCCFAYYSVVHHLHHQSRNHLDDDDDDDILFVHPHYHYEYPSSSHPNLMYQHSSQYYNCHFA